MEKFLADLRLHPYEKYFRPLLIYLTSFFKTLNRVNRMPDNFWRLNIDDVLACGTMLLVTLSIWAGVILTGPFSSVPCYWDGPNYIFAGITFYDIERDNPWTKYFGYDPSYFACHLPGFPLVIRIFAFFTCGNYYVANLLAIIFSGMLLAYAFRRVLIAYKCVANPLFTTILLAFVPMRLVIYHSVGASEPLFIAEVCFVMIFYKFNEYTKLILAVWCCCVTRIEGMAVGAAIGVCYVLQFDILHGLMMFLTFVSTICLLLFHKAMFNDALAYLTFNKGRQGLIGLPPFHEVLGGSETSNVNHLHSFIDFYAPYVIGAMIVVYRAGPLGVFSLGYLLYISLVRHMDLYRYSLPAAVFVILVGFDGLWSHPYAARALAIIGPFYLIEMIIYAAGQIHSNRCPDHFLDEVLRAAEDRIH